MKEMSRRHEYQKKRLGNLEGVMTPGSGAQLW